MPLRTKMGQIFHALRPSSLRSRRDSTWSLNAPDLSHSSAEHTQHPLSLSTPIPGQRQPLIGVPRVSHPKGHGKRLSQTRSVDSLRKSSSSDDRSLARVQSHDPASPLPLPNGRVPMRHANTISPVMPTGESSTPALLSPVSPADAMDVSRPSHPSASPSAPVFRWLLPFLYRDGAHPAGAQSSEQLPTPSAVPPPPPPRRGDVVCLKYDTLDDKGMRRLEGRSDHRPVIGAYAVYI